MRAAVAVKARTQVSRPLPVLVPLIQQELSAGNNAGIEHYRRAGEMLLEAREQVAAFKWGKWLSKNFELSRSTAGNYMRLAQRLADDPDLVQRVAQPSLRSIVTPNARPLHAHWQPVFEAAKKVDIDEFVEVRQARAEEMQLHRDLALELIDIGFKALATRLHPDRGGSKDAMRRLNRVRDELRTVAKTRRFE
jgi:Protein of unknown function (DUF3102).